MSSPSLTEAEIGEFREAFRLFEKGGAGHVTYEELTTLLKSLNTNEAKAPTEAEAKALIKEVDADGNGTINFPDFLVQQSSRMKDVDSKEELKKAFVVFDKDGKGYITPNELRAAMTGLADKLTDEEVTEMIREADVNKDGKILFDKFYELMTS